MVHPPLAGEVLKLAEANVSTWVVAEKIKAATAKAKNDLETYIINTREKLEVNEQYLEVGESLTATVSPHASSAPLTCPAPSRAHHCLPVSPQTMFLQAVHPPIPARSLQVAKLLKFSRYWCCGALCTHCNRRQ